MLSNNVYKKLSDKLGLVSKGIFFKICIKIYSSSYANDVSVGDEVLVESNNEAIHTQVVNVSSLFLQGNASY